MSAILLPRYTEPKLLRPGVTVKEVSTNPQLPVQEEQHRKNGATLGMGASNRENESALFRQDFGQQIRTADSHGSMRNLRWAPMQLGNKSAHLVYRDVSSHSAGYSE